MMSAAVAGTTFRPTPSYTTLRDVTRWLIVARRVLVLGGDRSGKWTSWHEENIPAADNLHDVHLSRSTRNPDDPNKIVGVRFVLSGPSMSAAWRSSDV